MSQLSLRTTFIGASLATALLLSGCASLQPSVPERSDAQVESSEEKKSSENAVIAPETIANEYITALSTVDYTQIENSFTEVGEIIQQANADGLIDPAADQSTLSGSLAGLPESVQLELLEKLQKIDPASSLYSTENLETTQLIALHLISSSVAMQFSSLLEGSDTPQVIVDSKTTVDNVTYFLINTENLDEAVAASMKTGFPEAGIPLVEVNGEWAIAGDLLFAFFEEGIASTMAESAETPTS